MKLTPEQIEQYHRDGYIGVEGVFSSEEVDELCRVTDEFVEKARDVDAHNETYDLEPDHSAQNPRVRRIKKPHERHPVYDAAARNERLLDIVEQLIGPGVRLQSTKLNMKEGGAPSPVEWHQDWAFYPYTNDDLLAVGITLDDMAIENGCLMAIPGSHKGKIFDHHQDGLFIGAITEADFDYEDAVPIELKAGGVSIHHVRALHGSAANTSDRPRRLLLQEYCAVDAFPLNGISDWEEFNSRIFRGEPAQEPRLEKVPVRLPWPRAEGGSIFELQEKMAKPQYGQQAARTG